MAMVVLNIVQQLESGTMKKYSHEHWNQVIESPTERGRESDLRLIGKLATGNLFWFVRRLISLDSDIANFTRYPDWKDQFIEPTPFTKYRRRIQNENTVSQN